MSATIASIAHYLKKSLDSNMATRLPSPLSYTIGYIAVVPAGRVAATALLDQRHDPPHGFVQHSSDPNAYIWGRMSGHNIVITSLPVGVYGTVAATITVSCLLASLPHIRVGLLVGIAGAVSRPDSGQDIRLGDVVVSQPEGRTGGVIQHDFGKAKLNAVWEPKGTLNTPPMVFLQALSSLQARHEFPDSKISGHLREMLRANPQMSMKSDGTTNFQHPGLENDRLFTPTYTHTGDDESCQKCDPKAQVPRPDRPTSAPTIHYGVIASGNKLVKDAVTRDMLFDRCDAPFLCLEMEAAGVMNHFPCLVIRGISNYADSHSNGLWQGYASATAAAFAKEFLGFVPRPSSEATS